MEYSEESAGILEIESLSIYSQPKNYELMDSSSDYILCNEDFNIEAAAEMMHTEDIRSFEETPMEQDTYMTECICCVDNVHHEVPVDQLEMTVTSTPQSECQLDMLDMREPVDFTPIITKAPLSRHVTFDLSEISATSTEHSEYQLDMHEPLDFTPITTKAPLSRHVTFDLSEISTTSTEHSEYQLDMHEPVVLSPILRRRSSRIQTQKRKASEMTPNPVNIRKGKFNGSPGSAPKVRRTNSLDRASNSSANSKESNQKVAKKRMSTGSTRRPRRQSGKFNKH